VRDVPVHSVLRMPTAELARAYPRGDILLRCCPECGFVFNAAFESKRLQYGGDYEETQAFSPTFREFHRRLAVHLIERYDIRSRRVLEIGCGKGEFLGLLCELGDNRGIGFDPSYVPGRGPESAAVEIVPELYGEAHGTAGADLICCKMTLEHVHPVMDFVSMLHRAVGGRRDVVVFFQVPDFDRIVRDRAFWDIYYEHCSYFTRDSLAALFRACGFEIIETWTDYGAQYLMIEARVAERPVDGDSRRADVVEEIGAFAQGCRKSITEWQERLRRLAERGQRVVLWGGGSKAVAFLAAVDRAGVVEIVVDINPYKQGTFLPGGGQRIVAPAFLADYGPRAVIVMNPIYRAEIAGELSHLGLQCEVMTV
jgi:SAM-dependent methyltransferase